VKSRYVRIFGLLCLFALATALSPPPTGAATVEGRIGLTLQDGTVAHGDWIRVLLVTEAVDAALIQAEVEAQIAQGGEGRQGVRSNRLHLELYKAVTARIGGSPGYVAASTLTTEDGRFKFTGVPPGAYWVLITFPSIIEGYKVAWQVPVTVADGGAAMVALTEANLLFPLAPPQ
jgi:hypothetical protein